MTNSTTWGYKNYLMNKLQREHSTRRWNRSTSKCKTLEICKIKCITAKTTTWRTARMSWSSLLLLKSSIIRWYYCSRELVRGRPKHSKTSWSIRPQLSMMTQRAQVRTRCASSSWMTAPSATGVWPSSSRGCGNRTRFKSSWSRTTSSRGSPRKSLPRCASQSKSLSRLKSYTWQTWSASASRRPSAW